MNCKTLVSAQNCLLVTLGPNCFAYYTSHTYERISLLGVSNPLNLYYKV